MPINFPQAKQQLKNVINQQRGAGGGAVFAREFTSWYDQTMRRGGDALFQNPVLSANPAGLQSTLTAALSAPAPPNVFQQAIATGIPLYWTGATLALATPPPGSGPVVSNVVTSPGTIAYTLPAPNQSIDIFINTLVAAIQQHLLTVTGITTSLVPTPGGPVPTAFPWVGYQ